MGAEWGAEWGGVGGKNHACLIDGHARLVVVHAAQHQVHVRSVETAVRHAVQQHVKRERQRDVAVVAATRDKGAKRKKGSKKKSEKRESTCNTLKLNTANCSLKKWDYREKEREGERKKGRRTLRTERRG